MMIYLIIAVVFAAAVAIGLKKRKQISQLRDDGKIIRREYRFAEKGELFTSKIGSYVELKKELEKMLLPCAMKGNTSSKVEFTAKNYTARLYRVDFHEPSGVGQYRFEFTSWKNGRYGYLDETGMNILMTSIEKAFLALDPNTGVSTYGLNFKTSHSFL